MLSLTNDWESRECRSVCDIESYVVVWCSQVKGNALKNLWWECLKNDLEAFSISQTTATWLDPAVDVAGWDEWVSNVADRIMCTWRTEDLHNGLKLAHALKSTTIRVWVAYFLSPLHSLFYFYLCAYLQLFSFLLSLMFFLASSLFCFFMLSVGFSLFAPRLIVDCFHIYVVLWYIVKQHEQSHNITKNVANDWCIYCRCRLFFFRAFS